MKQKTWPAYTAKIIIICENNYIRELFFQNANRRCLAGFEQILEEYKIWVFVAQAYSYVAHFRPDHGVKTGKQVASSNKWRLGENVVLRLMECLVLVLIFICLWTIISHLFVYLSTLELTKFQRQVGSTKIGYTNAQSLGTNSLKKGKVSTLSSGHQARKQCTFDQNNSRALYIAFFKSCNPKRFVRCRNKVEKKYIQEQQPSQFHCCNQNTAFVNRMGQHLVKHSLGIRIKK